MESVQRAIVAIRKREPAIHLLNQIPDEIVPLFLSRIIDAAIADEPQPDVLEWVWQRGGEKAITTMTVIRANLHTNLWVFDWLLTKKPDIFSWEYCSFWEVLARQTTAFDCIYS
jgi:hypothetical protein